MNRKAFFKHLCCGICSGVGLTLLSNENVAAQAETEESKDDWRVGFMQKRFNIFIRQVQSAVDEETRDKLLEAMGRSCAQESESHYIKFKNNVEGLLAEMTGQWLEKAEYHSEKNEIMLFSRETGRCVCPFVKVGETATSFCSCSKGYQMQMFETVLEKPVEVVIMESVLRGSQRCSFLIKT
ncbi:MAG: hypothetical protein EHM72_03280 [Calditrichaeota bacterium]|nr:MAG: hypothetical protein EHM72_03280 [Calditrichota bacterium]